MFSFDLVLPHRQILLPSLKWTNLFSRRCIWPTTTHIIVFIIIIIDVYCILSNVLAIAEGVFMLENKFSFYWNFSFFIPSIIFILLLIITYWYSCYYSLSSFSLFYHRTFSTVTSSSSEIYTFRMRSEYQINLFSLNPDFIFDDAKL